MKLNQTQGKALAEVLAKQINDKIKIHNDLLEEKAFKDPKLEKAREEFIALQKKAKELTKHLNSYYLREFSKENANNLSFKVNTKLRDRVSKDEIFNELILATIEATDLEQVKAAIIKKFS
jgi:chemotaxis regulatin CheY-phosphate phosphatase CheZ